MEGNLERSTTSPIKWSGNHDRDRVSSRHPSPDARSRHKDHRWLPKIKRWLAKTAGNWRTDEKDQSARAGNSSKKDWGIEEAGGRSEKALASILWGGSETKGSGSAIVVTGTATSSVWDGPSDLRHHIISRWTIPTVGRGPSLLTVREWTIQRPLVQCR